MDITYRKANAADLSILVDLRIEVLRAANQLDDTVDMATVQKQSIRYYKDTFKSQTQITYLAYDQDVIAGCGSVSIFQVMPTYHNATGNKAYIMNMYTKATYRRHGIAQQILDLLIQDVRALGIDAISLEATAMGRPLYEKYGFISLNDEMELPAND